MFISMNGLMTIYPIYGILKKKQMNDHCIYDDSENIIIYDSDNQMIIVNVSHIFIYLPFPWQFGVSTNVR